MKRKDFIAILECALKSADQHVVETSQAPNDPNEIRIYLDDCSTVSIDISDCSLLDILETTAFALKVEHRKDQLGLKPQCITRRGIQFNGKWHCTEELLMNHGQQVFAIPCGKVLMIQSASSGHMFGGITLD